MRYCIIRPVYGVYRIICNKFSLNKKVIKFNIAIVSRELRPYEHKFYRYFGWYLKYLSGAI